MKQIQQGKHHIIMTAAMLVGLTTLVGCTTTPRSQTGKVSSAPKIVTNQQGVPNYYRVKKGDTVSRIAARYGLNYRQVGAMNRLDSNYTIYPGQYLKLWDNGRRQAAVTSTTASTPNRNRPVTSRPTGASPSTPPPIYSTSNTANTISSLHQYPSKNQIIRQFDGNTNLGLWFAGNVGDPVYASSHGVVLYAGNGLEQYGNLVLIRHDKEWVTAYAHNNHILVKEGDSVNAGQQIATMGNTGQTNQVALEFQVRQNGVPVDPRQVLGR